MLTSQHRNYTVMMLSCQHFYTILTIFYYAKTQSVSIKKPLKQNHTFSIFIYILKNYIELKTYIF